MNSTDQVRFRQKRRETTPGIHRGIKQIDIHYI